MKKYSAIVFAAVSLIAASSCSKEMTSDIASGSGDMTFTATTDATKTALGSDGLSVAWTAGESISVFRFCTTGSVSDANCQFTMTPEGVKSDGSADFDGNVVDLSGSCTDAGAYYAASPYTDGAYLASGNKILVSIPQEAVGVAGGFPTVNGIAANPMVAKDNAGTFAFKNVASVIKFNLTYNDVNSVEIAGNDSEIVAGQFFATIDGSGNAAIAETVDGKTTAKLASADGTSALAPGVYYFLVKPQTFAKGVTFTMKTIFNQTRVKTTSSSIKFQKGAVAYVGDMVENVTVFPVEWPLCMANNTEEYHPEWTLSSRFYSGQPARAQMEFVPNVISSSANYALLPSLTNSTTTLVSSPSFSTSTTVKKIYMYDNDSFYFFVKLDDFSGRLKFTIPVINTNGPKFWYLSFSTDGSTYTKIDARDFVVIASDDVEYTTNATWDCHFWNTGSGVAAADKKCDNVLIKEIPYDFEAFTGTLRIKFSVAPIIAPASAAGQILRNAASEKCALVPKRSSGMGSRFFFADARNFSTSFAATPISIAVVE